MRERRTRSWMVNEFHRRKPTGSEAWQFPDWIKYMRDKFPSMVHRHNVYSHPERDLNIHDYVNANGNFVTKYGVGKYRYLHLVKQDNPRRFSAWMEARTACGGENSGR